MKGIKKYTINLFLLGIISLSVPFYFANAASIGFSPASGSYNVGDTINVKVYIGTESKSVNAISANIKYPTNLLSLSSVSKTGSIINLWAQEPSFSNGEGVASFEGVILNGYIGNSGNAVTLVFKAKQAGKAEIRFDSASVLANDGNGTEVLYSKGTSNLTILNSNAKPVTPKEDTTSSKDLSITISEIKNNLSQYSPNKFLITAVQQVADKSYAIQIDSMPSVIWTDDGTHIYQAPELSNGVHNIKVMAVDINANSLSGFLNFYTTFLKIPTITYYPKESFVDDFMVLKGIADPSVDVEITMSNNITGGVIIEHVSTNGNGEFTFVPKNKMALGVYSIIARSVAPNGTNSDYMSPIQVNIIEHKLNSFIAIFTNYLLLFIPLLALILLLILIILYGYNRIRKFNENIKKKLLIAENIVSKDFETLKKDIDKEAIVSSKLKDNEKLNEEEATTLVDFKEDIKNTEKEIVKNIEGIEG